MPAYIIAQAARAKRLGAADFTRMMAEGAAP